MQLSPQQVLQAKHSSNTTQFLYWNPLFHEFAPVKPIRLPKTKFYQKSFIKAYGANRIDERNFVWNHKFNHLHNILSSVDNFIALFKESIS